MATLPIIPGVEIFRAGTFHKGTPEEVTFSDADLQDMVRNHQILSAGPRPLYKPTAKIGSLDPHKGPSMSFQEEGNPAAGIVTNLRKEGSVLKCDLADVPWTVAGWIKNKLFRQTSAEIDRPSRGETHPDFPQTKGPVLKQVSLLGQNAPAVKGLLDIPMPRMPAYGFASKRNKLTRLFFTEVNMDPSIAAFLTSKGLDPNMSDLNAVVAAWMKEAGGAGGAPQGPPAAQFTGDPGLTTKDPANNNPMDYKKMMSATDLNGLALLEKQQTQLPPALRGTFAELTASVAYLQESVKSSQALSDRQAQNTKRALVNTFCEQMTSGSEPRLTPADVECDKTGEPLPHTVKARLYRADHTKFHVFSENGGQVTKTELELQMDGIRRQKPLHFSERMRQTTPGEPSANDPAAQAAKSAAAYAEKRNKQMARTRS